MRKKKRGKRALGDVLALVRELFRRGVLPAENAARILDHSDLNSTMKTIIITFKLILSILLRKKGKERGKEGT